MKRNKLMEPVNYHPAKTSELLDYYIQNHIGQCENCIECKSISNKKGHPLINGPVPFFHIGSYWTNMETRLLFLGMVAYGWEGELKDKFFDADLILRNKNKEQVVNAIEERICDLYYHQQRFKQEGKMRYFSYIRAATELTLGSDGYSKIAISNLLKCNSGEVRNYYPQASFDYCIRKEYTGNLYHDVEILKPTHIVILSGDDRKYGRYQRLMEEIGAKALMMPHPSSSKAGTIATWSTRVKDFTLSA